MPLETSVLNTYDTFVFDVDRTIADNGDDVPVSIIMQLLDLLNHVNVALVTARGMITTTQGKKERKGIDRFVATLTKQLGNKSGSFEKHLYLFTATATEAYKFNFQSKQLDTLYNKFNEDENFRKFYHSFRNNLPTLNGHKVQLVDDVKYDESAETCEVQVEDKTVAATLFFSHKFYRDSYQSYLEKQGISCTPHARNTLHTMPKGVNKSITINYLQKNGSNKILVFADGFYELENGAVGNDRVFAEFPEEQVTCINVGKHPPSKNLPVCQPNPRGVHECELTFQLLTDILSHASMADLRLLKPNYKPSNRLGSN